MPAASADFCSRVMATRKRPPVAAVFPLTRRFRHAALIEPGADVGQLPGQQLGDTVHRMVGDAFDDPAQVGFRVEPV